MDLLSQVLESANMADFRRNAPGGALVFDEITDPFSLSEGPLGGRVPAETPQNRPRQWRNGRIIYDDREKLKLAGRRAGSADR